MNIYAEAATHLAALYTKSFGGKANGRYRMSAKQMKELLGRKRLYADDVALLTRAALEEGMVLIDMDSFFVVMAANSFVNYRRLSGDMLSEISMPRDT